MKRINITKLTMYLSLFLVLLSSCKDDEQDVLGVDVFRPKILSEVVEKNVVKLYWYKVLDATSYTIQLADDEEFTNILDEQTTEELSYTSPKLPYDTRFYIRLRTNAKDPGNNSIWQIVETVTHKRDVKPILMEVDDDDILETAVVLRWEVDSSCPADQLVIEGVEDLIPTNVTVDLTKEQFQKGAILVENLEMAKDYKATIYNSQLEDVYERPYNSVVFKTAGPPKGAKVIMLQDDLDAILLEDKANPEILDGQVYYVREAGTYNVAGFEFEKGFQIIGAPGKDVVINVTSPFTPGSTAGKIIFNKIALTGTERFVSNQQDDGKNYVWEGMEMIGCNVTGFAEGFIILQTSTGNQKEIKNLYIDNCIFNEMGGGCLLETNNFSDTTSKMVQVNKLIVINTTFINSPNMRFLYFPDAYGNSGGTIDLIMRNVTVFESLGRAGNYRTIQMNKLSNQSKVSISKCLFSNEVNASNDQYMFYETCLCGSAVTSYSDNYITGTRDETGRKGVSAKKLNLSQDDLFVNPSEGNLNIKDVASVVCLDQIGDPRWLK